LIVSGGVLVKGTNTIWTGTPATWGNWSQSIELSARWSSYSSIYREQLWVAVLVNKLARAQARLPLKAYLRNADGREEARDHPYAVMLRDPHPRLSSKELWRWTVSTRNVFGEALWVKERDAGGRPIRLHPIHPTSFTNEMKDGRVVYEIHGSSGSITDIDEAEVVHFKEYNPDSFLRGMSALEPLRQTLVNEDSSRRATSAFWANGSRPSIALKTPKTLSQPAQDRVALNWSQIHAGPENWGKVAILEEGMEPTILSVNNEEAQYTESRRLNREEACAIYDVPPPVVHILDRATYSNITEQMRSMYRDTMATRLGEDEAVLEKQLRSSGRKGATGPDFGDDVYGEFLMDEVLRGAFEDRAAAMQAAINSGQLTPNEARTLDNRKPMEGGDRLYINSTMVPLDPPTGQMSSRQLAEALQKIYLSVDTVITPDEAREILNREGAGLTGPGPNTEPKGLTQTETRTVMGRLSRQTSLAEVDPKALVHGLNGATPVVLEALAQATVAGENVAVLRERIQRLGRQKRTNCS